MSLFRMAARSWRKSQRAADLRILWPACREQASTLEDAQFAFYVHCLGDPAWTRDFGDAEIYAEVRRLT